MTALRSLKLHDGTIFDTKQTLPERDFSLEKLSSNLTAIDGIIQRFEKNNFLSIVPKSRLDTLNVALKEMANETINNYTTLKELLDNDKHIEFGEKLQFGDVDDEVEWAAYLGEKILTKWDALLEAYYNVLMILKPSKTAPAFQAATNALSQISDDAVTGLKSLREDYNALKAELSALQQTRGNVETDASKVTSLLNESESAKTEIDDFVSEAESQKDEIESIASEAGDLKTSVTAYQEKFDAFKIQLDDRDNLFKKGRDDLDKLIKAAEAHKEKVEGLIEQSDGMLKGATTAGLSASFNTRKTQLDEDVDNAQRSFRNGIIFLAISVALFVIWTPATVYFNVQSTSSTQGSGMWFAIGQFVMRSLIVLPGLLFVGFTSQRYNALFRLREHYAYKYSMAVSVDGFKKQAPQYEDEIAALALEQIAFNPADHLKAAKNAKDVRPTRLFQQFKERLRQKLSPSSEEVEDTQ